MKKSTGICLALKMTANYFNLHAEEIAGKQCNCSVSPSVCGMCVEISYNWNHWVAA